MVNILDYQEKCNRESKPNLKKFFHFLKKKYILSRIKLNERMYSKKIRVVFVWPLQFVLGLFLKRSVQRPDHHDR